MGKEKGEHDQAFHKLRNINAKIMTVVQTLVHASMPGKICRKIHVKQTPWPKT